MVSRQPLVAAIDCGMTQVKAGIFQLNRRLFSPLAKPCYPMAIQCLTKKNLENICEKQGYEVDE
ncbi:MAG: hypothetical protein KKD39_00070 [Candidatus Altiarchaeota archaeon]|nr:hypothetical protein [Candidatus Altiarchaeota archaeon]